MNTFSANNSPLTMAPSHYYTNKLITNIIGFYQRSDGFSWPMLQNDMIRFMNNDIPINYGLTNRFSDIITRFPMKSQLHLLGTDDTIPKMSIYKMFHCFTIQELIQMHHTLENREGYNFE
jgi:hypothetical protein